MMMKFGEFHDFMRRYFPIFLLGFFIAIISIAFSVALWVDSHWRKHPDNPLYTMIFSGILVVLLCLGHFVMIRGKAWAIWPVLIVIATTLCMAVSLVGHGLNGVLLAVLLAMPLLGILVLNSSRHREMRRRLIELRKERQLKVQRPQ